MTPRARSGAKTAGQNPWARARAVPRPRQPETPAQLEARADKIGLTVAAMKNEQMRLYIRAAVLREGATA